MSEQNSSLETANDPFDSMDGEPIEGFADLDDDYADDDADDFGETLPGAGRPTANAAEIREQVERVKAAPVRSHKPRQVAKGPRGISSAELGFLFTTCTLVAAAGVGSACLLAAGVSPATLWRPGELLAVQNYFNLDSHPLNLLALVVLGTLVLTLLGSRAIARAANGANNRYRHAELMLSRLTSLRLDNEEAWQGAVFREHPAAYTFVAEVLGAWRLLSARQKRYMGLEGELHRLEKALANNSRQDLTGRFDNPAVGGLADEMVRYFDERAAAVRDTSEFRNNMDAESDTIVSRIRDARNWNRVVREQLGAHGVALERVAARLRDTRPQPGDAAAGVGETVKTVVAGLVEIGQKFQAQSDRLLGLGATFAEVAGVEFDADDTRSIDPDNPTPGSLSAPVQDPFCASPTDAAPEVDPFASDTDAPETQVMPEFTRGAESLAPPVAETSPATEPRPELPPLEIETAFTDGRLGASETPAPASIIDPVPFAVPTSTPAAEVETNTPQLPVSEPEEKVYDLEEFGAVPVEERAGDAADPVHELAEFGAVRLDKGDDAKPEHRIYDLSEFGAVAVP